MFRDAEALNLRAERRKTQGEAERKREERAGEDNDGSRDVFSVSWDGSNLH